MYFSFSIFDKGSYYTYSLDHLDGYYRVDRPGIVILDISKHHNHRYDLHGFFYEKKVIVGPFSFRSKRELHGAIQKLLQQYL